MRKTLFLISILLISIGFVQAQDKPQAYKFDEFSDLQESEWKQNLDRFSEMLVSLPDAKLHVIVYAESGKSRFTIEESIRKFKNYFGDNKKLKSEKFSVERGGFRYSQISELWIIPKNADKPIPTPIEKFENKKIAEVGYASDEEFNKLMKGFYEKLMKGEIYELYLINYGSKEELTERNRQIDKSITFRSCYGRFLTIVDVESSANLKTVIWDVLEGEGRPAL